tara:strand:+ start:3428 stop:5032 length:1605 start_codon:yes stop_codon:yes gene_type:complete
MIKKLSTNFIIIIIALIIGYILAITFNNLLQVYTNVKENNKKINFIKNINNNNNIPSLCFQSAYELAKNTETKLPEIFPLGALPLKNKNNLINFDKFGFRNNENVWKKNNHDFLILGDSVVVDNRVTDEHILSNNFNNKSTINLGCGGNGLLTSLHLVEQILQANYNFNNILFFINFDNDFSKDTIREYNTQLFSQPYKFKNINLFLNEKEYEIDYLKFVKDAFSKEISNFSFKMALLNEFNIDKYLKPIKPNTKEKVTKVLLEDGRKIDSTIIPKGSYNTKMYNVFLKILERIAFLKQNYNTNITLIFIPTNDELNIYKSKRNNDTEWNKYIEYKYLKNTILSTVANYNINIIDLYNFIKENDYVGFTNGHFEKDYHPLLSEYIIKNINNNTNTQLQKLYFYNSFYPSKNFFNYQVNFGMTLSSNQLKNLIDIINKLMKKNVIDNYLLTPSLGYLFINQNCDKILELNEISNNNLIKYSVGSFFYKVCNLKNTEDINKSIKEINFLIENDIKYYIPSISYEIKNSLGLINESK